MHLGTLIARFREEERMSMDEFASRSGLSKAYISMLERNVNSRSGKPIVPSLETIKAVSGAIGVDFNAVISIIDPDTKVVQMSTKKSRPRERLTSSLGLFSERSERSC